MKHDARIFVAGSGGLVGAALVRRLRAGGYVNLLTPARAELDLTCQAAVADFFARERPEYVLLAAAKVGGIHANAAYPAEFIQVNLAIQGNVIDQARRHGVQRLLFLGSSCIYPRLAPQPLREEALLTGPLEPTNEPYAIAKIAGLKLCEACNRQYGTRFFAVMPTNLYGPGDNFHPENAHVLPALLRRFHEAKADNAAAVTIWGSGTPRREFLHVDDMADACVFLLEQPDAILAPEVFNYPRPCFVNLGSGVEVTIRELAETIREVVGYAGALRFDPTRPDGTPRKLLDVTRLTALGWRSRTPLHEGIAATYRWYLRQLP